MNINTLESISPIDGRYRKTVENISEEENNTERHLT